MTNGEYLKAVSEITEKFLGADSDIELEEVILTLKEKMANGETVQITIPGNIKTAWSLKKEFER